MHPSNGPGLIAAFVNTYDVEERSDELGSPAALRAWLAAHGLRTGSSAAGPRELLRARALRDGLRDLLAGNAGFPVAPEEAFRELDAASLRSGLRVRFLPDDSTRVESTAAGVDGALGRILVEVALAMANGSWPRLKACANEECRWAFFDGARNNSRRWCSMAVCGNRMKARSYRSRQPR